MSFKAIVLFLQILTLLKLFILNFALYVLIYMLYINLLIYINLDPLYSIFKCLIKVYNEYIQVQDYELFSEVIKVLKGLEIYLFVLLIDDTKGDIEGYTDI